MIRLKTGVNPTGVHTEILLAIVIAEAVYQSYDYELVITSLNDSEHSTKSRHYLGMAADLRTRMIAPRMINEVVEKLRKRLGRHYLVLFEHNHIHIGYQPRKP